MVIDAGGGTVDISSYSFTSTAPLAVEEIAAAECEYDSVHGKFSADCRSGIMQGSTRVNVRAEKFLKGWSLNIGLLYRIIRINDTTFRQAEGICLRERRRYQVDAWLLRESHEAHIQRCKRKRLHQVRLHGLQRSQGEDPPRAASAQRVRRYTAI